MNDAAPPQYAQSGDPAGRERGSHSDPESDLRTRLDDVDRMAAALAWGLPVVGLLGGARLLLESVAAAAGSAGGWLSGLLGMLALGGGLTLAGLTLASVLRALTCWLPRRAAAAQVQGWGADETAEVRAAATRGQAIAEIRRFIQDGNLIEAMALLEAREQAEPREPGLEALRAEAESARAHARTAQLAQLRAAREVSDADRVLELYQSLAPLLDDEATANLDADLSRWFLRLLHNRLRGGKIQPELAILATRIADAFSHTADGASLRASLPTLRRSAGLCPRCGQPFLGLASACPACLGQVGAAGPAG